jgi:hypothetical protein
MVVDFTRKTNKKSNSIFQIKSQIHRRAEAIRRQQARDTSGIKFGRTTESELFKKAPIHYVVVGWEPGYESE